MSYLEDMKNFQKGTSRDPCVIVCIIPEWKIKSEIVRMCIGDNLRNIRFVRSVVNMSSFYKYVIIGF